MQRKPSPTLALPHPVLTNAHSPAGAGHLLGLIIGRLADAVQPGVLLGLLRGGGDHLLFLGLGVLLLLPLPLLGSDRQWGCWVACRWQTVCQGRRRRRRSWRGCRWRCWCCRYGHCGSTDLYHLCHIFLFLHFQVSLQLLLGSNEDRQIITRATRRSQLGNTWIFPPAKYSPPPCPGKALLPVDARIHPAIAQLLETRGLELECEPQAEMRG